MCLKCRKHNNYLNIREKVISSSRSKWEHEKFLNPRPICSICKIRLNKNNVSGMCRLHYKQVKTVEQRRVYNSSWYANSGYSYHRDRYKNDLNFRISHILRARLNMALKNNQKVGSAVRDLGCSIPELKKHLESKFTKGMSWNNYGEWHIDHIKPLSSFDLSNPEELKRACYYTNLQPLWAEDNLSKGSSTN